MKDSRIDVKKLKDRQAKVLEARAALALEQAKGEPTTIKTLAERMKKLEAAAGVC